MTSLTTTLSQADQQALREMAAWLVAGLALDCPYFACATAISTAFWYLATNETVHQSNNGGMFFTVGVGVAAYFAFDKPRRELAVPQAAARRLA